MTGRFAQLREAEEGATAVEMALVMFATLLLILGMVEFAIAYWTMNTLELAVQEAGRHAYVMINNSAISPAQYPQTLESYMQQYLPGPSTQGCTSPNPGQFCVNAVQSPSGNTVTLQASYGFDVLGITGTYTLGSQNTVPLD
jgi:Flp pilus assembly protein TadG